MPNEIHETLKTVVAALEQHRIRYCLIGGLAVGMRGSSRSTFDVALLLTIPQVTLPGFLSRLAECGFEFDPLSAIQTWQRNGMLPLTAANASGCNSNGRRLLR